MLKKDLFVSISAPTQDPQDRNDAFRNSLDFPLIRL